MTETQKLREALQAISHIDDTTNHSVDASAALDRIGQIARQALALPTKAEPAAQEADNLYEKCEAEIVRRYVVEQRNGGGFWRYCVRATGGTQEIYIGHKNDCERVRQALQTACLDGAFMAEIANRGVGYGRT